MIAKNVKERHTWICEKCPKTFTNHDEYIRHKAKHQIGKIKDEPIKNPAGEPATPIAEGQEKDGKDPDKSVTEFPLKGKQSESFKIDLKYVYEGRCSCGNPVKTLELDVGSDNLKNKTHLVIAYCMKCDKALRERVVTKL